MKRLVLLCSMLLASGAACPLAIPPRPASEWRLVPGKPEFMHDPRVTLKA